MTGVLLPLAKFMLRSGLGCSEFIAIAKVVFVHAATDEYGLRGRPTNISRVAAMTGLSRKEVRRIREHGPVARWTPDMELNPANTIIHFWHFDSAFSEISGSAKRLPFEGDNSFSTLVRKYAGDIPPGAMRTELIRAGTITEDDEGCLEVRERYFWPKDFDEDFVRNAAFALKNLGNTIIHNASVAGDSSACSVPPHYFERFAWTDRFDVKDIEVFKAWVRSEGAEFVERADSWIGSRELPQEANDRPQAVGVGVYYFEENLPY